MPKIKVIQATLLFLLLGNHKVLLAPKLQKIGRGFLNGYGGRIKKDETPEDCAIREFKEESKLAEVNHWHLEKIALANFHNNKEDGTKFIVIVHVYVARTWYGCPCATKEMGKPKWYNICSLPINRLMLADRYWLPQALNGEKVLVTACYGPNQRSLIGDVCVEKVKSFSEG
jgi:ADP-ribose pyrophosphatase YjhB (NUDIX family)